LSVPGEIAQEAKKEEHGTAKTPRAPRKKRDEEKI
jgi:hypothetical protein